jgi:hypothetical protein
LLFILKRNPIHSISWLKDGYRLKDENNKQFILLNGMTSELNIQTNSNEMKKRKKSITIHTNKQGTHKFVSKLKIKVNILK